MATGPKRQAGWGPIDWLGHPFRRYRCSHRPSSRFSRLRKQRIKRTGLGALRQRSLRHLLAAQLTSVTGDYIVIAALPFAVFSIGGSTTQVSVAFGLSGALEVVLVLFGGVIGDRFQRRSVMIAADLARLASQAILAILLICGVAQFWQLLAVQIAQGAGAAFFQPAMSGLIPEVASKRRLQDANALCTIAVAAAAMLGPAIAGLLIATAGAGWAFALDAATFGASAALLTGIRVPPAPRSDASLIGALAEGWGEFRRHTWLWVVVLEFALLNALVFGPFQVLGASVADQSLGGSGAWAVILTAAGAGQLGGGLLALLWRPQRPLFTATLLIASWAAPMALLAVAAPLIAIAAAAAVAGTTIALFGAIWHTTLQSRVPREQRSRMSSYDWLGSLALLPLGYLVAGVSQALIGNGATLLAGAFIVLIATAIVVPQPAIRGMLSREPRRVLTLATATSGGGPQR
jgi:MFS family permease